MSIEIDSSKGLWVEGVAPQPVAKAEADAVERGPDWNAAIDVAIACVDSYIDVAYSSMYYVEPLLTDAEVRRHEASRMASVKRSLSLLRKAAR